MQKLEAHGPDAQSADLVAIKLEELKALLPELITEGPNGVAVDIEVLRALVGAEVVDESDEKYGLNWHGKRQARQLALTPSTGTLRPYKDESINWDVTKNLMIEGDNLEVLKLLQKGYAGGVKLIYIDPPYNTGKDFVYPDNFQDNIKNYLELTGQLDGGQKVSSNTESSGRFHTDWLNMIYPRLKLARNLLCEDGVIFISIDDREVANLRKVCDEIFGDDNFIANVVWQKKYTRSNDARWFSDNHDHILVYGRDKNLVTLNGQARNDDQLRAYTNPDNHPKGAWKATPLHAKSGVNTKPFKFKNGIVWQPPKGTFRRFNDASMLEMDEGEEIWFGEEGNLTPQRKSFLSEVKQGVTPVTLWPYQEVGHNHEANSDLKALGLGGLFDNPKPVKLIGRMIDLVTSSNQEDIVLDFFAGSGTTGQAVIEANIRDAGNRRFICVQLPEPIEPIDDISDFTVTNIAGITAERIRRVVRKNKEVNPNYDGDLGFRLLKLDVSNIKSWDSSALELEQELFDNVDRILPGRSNIDILYELLLKLGIDICSIVNCRVILGYEVFFVNGVMLIACLAPSIALKDVEGLATGIVDMCLGIGQVSETICVFRDDAFCSDVAKLNMSAILEQSGIKNVRSL